MRNNKKNCLWSHLSIFICLFQEIFTETENKQLPFVIMRVSLYSKKLKAIFSICENKKFSESFGKSEQRNTIVPISLWSSWSVRIQHWVFLYFFWQYVRNLNFNDWKISLSRKHQNWFLWQSLQEPHWFRKINSFLWFTSFVSHYWKCFFLFRLSISAVKYIFEKSKQLPCAL